MILEFYCNKGLNQLMGTLSSSRRWYYFVSSSEMLSFHAELDIADKLWRSQRELTKERFGPLGRRGWSAEQKRKSS